MNSVLRKFYALEKSQGWPVAVSTGNPAQARWIVGADENVDGQKGGPTAKEILKQGPIQAQSWGS